MKRYTCALLAIITVAFFTWTASQAGPPKEKSYSGSQAFERMKHLAGSWQGRQSMGPQDKLINVQYHLTAGGSSLIETLFPGTNEEMVSVYHDHDGQLAMTHYCMLGNQPRMKLKHAGGQSVELVFNSDGGDIDATRDAHMHALSIEWQDRDHIIQRWTLFENGRKSDVNELVLKRIE